MDNNVFFLNLFLRNHSEKIFFAGNIFASFGILLVTVGGSWDITNHLLNKPETFFSPPHALIYTGVAISLIGTFFSFVGWRNLRYNRDYYLSSLKIELIGIALLVGAGPFDFVWHSNFGLDGLLSPPHLTLISGMFLCSIGAMIGISRYLKIHNFAKKSFYLLLVLAVLPVWLSGSGIVSSLSLPFSNTDYFEFNPDPTFAFVVATVGFPFLISFSLLLCFRLAEGRFGVLSLLGGLFLLVSISTTIVPNFAISDSVLFYSLNLVPFVLSDFVLFLDRSKKYFLFVGGILGSVFYLVQYPYIMYTFNEILLGKLVSPSLIYFVYFELIQTVLPLTAIPAIAAGMVGVLISKNLSKKILTVGK